MPFLEGVPTVVLQLDKPRTLGFTMAAMRRIKEKAGTLELPVDANGRVPLEKAIDLMPTYIWACLAPEDRAEVSLEQLEEMLHPGNLEAVTQAIVSLFQRSNPEAAAGATPGPTTAGPKLATG